MKRKHWLLLLTAVIVALALVIALLRFMAELQDYGRETSLESHDFNYVFDGSKSAKDIKLTKGSSVDQTIRFVPHWSSDDYLRLARTLTPSGLKFSDDDMIVVSTRSYDCAQPTRIDQMYFDWSVLLL